MVPPAMSYVPFGSSPTRRLCAEPRLALHPVGTLLWLLLNLQWVFPVLCHPPSLILALSPVLILLPEDCCLHMLQGLDLHSGPVHYLLTGAQCAASTWPFLLGGPGPEAQPMPRVACHISPSFCPSPTLDAELSGVGVGSPVPSIALTPSKCSENVC